ncbi:MAG: hypothetical protein OHK0039_31550 [Bacteroidia bacterium]
MLLLMPWMALVAQPSKVTSGVLAYQNGDIADAIDKLETALAAGESNPELYAKSKARNLPKAYYHLYYCYSRVATDTSLTELRAKYPDAIFRAQDNFTKALAADDPTYGSYTKEWSTKATLEQAQTNIWAILVNEGLQIYYTGDSEQALKYFVAAETANPGQFLSSRMLGQTYIGVADTANAIKYLENAMSTYRNTYVNIDETEKAALKESQDYKSSTEQISYITQQLAVIYNAQGNTRKALDILAEGISYNPEDPDMKRQELNIYQQNPDLFEEAKQKFEAAIAAAPDEDQIKMAYAGLLDRTNRFDEAKALYQQVYDQDPNSLQANYGLGAFYVNQAAAISEKKMKMTKDADIEAADLQIIALLKQAYPFMKKLHELQPTEREWLSQLVTITGVLYSGESDKEKSAEMEAEMEMYGKKLGELNN